MASLVELQRVTKTFPGNPPVVAMNDISLSIPKGAFAAVIGPSGSGKSTLLNVASGLDRPTQGTVIVDGQKISNLSQSELCRFRSRRLGFVFQAYNLFPALSAVENVEFTSVLRGDDSRQARERAEHALELVGLGDRKTFFPTQLSGGQQQRVAVARALAGEPAIIFADEPTANLDSKTAIQLIELFEDLNRKLGITYLFSTHDPKLVERVRLKFEMCDGAWKKN